MQTPQATVAVSRHEQHYACGCTTMRVERVLLPGPEKRKCSGHGAALTKIIHITEFETEPAEQAWQLRPTD